MNEKNENKEQLVLGEQSVSRLESLNAKQIAEAYFSFSATKEEIEALEKIIFSGVWSSEDNNIVLNSDSAKNHCSFFKTTLNEMEKLIDEPPFNFKKAKRYSRVLRFALKKHVLFLKSQAILKPDFFRIANDLCIVSLKKFEVFVKKHNDSLCKKYKSFRRFLSKSNDRPGESGNPSVEIRDMYLQLSSLKQRGKVLKNRCFGNLYKEWVQEYSNWACEISDSLPKHLSIEDIMFLENNNDFSLRGELMNFVKKAADNKNPNLFDGPEILKTWKGQVEGISDYVVRHKDIAYFSFLLLFQENIPEEKKKRLGDAIFKYRDWNVERYLDVNRLNDKNIISFLKVVQLASGGLPIVFSPEHSEHIMKTMADKVKREQTTDPRLFKTYTKFLQTAGINLLKAEEENKADLFRESKQFILSFLSGFIPDEELNLKIKNKDILPEEFGFYT